MSIHGGNFRSIHRQAHIDGIGISERDALLSEFARQADLSLKDARVIISGNTNSICPKKLGVFSDAASKSYGGLDNLQAVYESLA